LYVPRSKPHAIADIKYTRNADPDDAPIVCVCGWSGRSAEYQQHRRTVGAPVVYLGTKGSGDKRTRHDA
jgi:hypothetical protein